MEKRRQWEYNSSKNQKKKELGSDGKKNRGWQGRKTLENRAEQSRRNKQNNQLTSSASIRWLPVTSLCNWYMAMAEAKAKPVKKEEARVRNIAAVSLALVSALQLQQIQSSCNLSHNWGSSSIILGNSVFCTIGK
jgi:hypothetical protein